jgi:hypothetical protein
VISDFDEDAVGRSVCVQHDLCARLGELEGVLQQVCQRREEPVSVTLDGEERVDRHHEEVASPRAGVQGSGIPCLGDERRNCEQLVLLGLAGCATAPRWGVSGADREHAVVRLSYEYPEFHQPTLSDEQALETAVNRCNGWGYDRAEPIEGQLRQCSNMNGSNCNLWTVTREYQCGGGDSSYAARLSR